MTVMPLLALLPHSRSGMFPSAMVGTSLLSRSMVSMLAAMESRVILQKLRHTYFSALL